MSWTILDRDRGEVQLSCGHTVVFGPCPSLGDTVYCHRCVDYQIVIDGGKERRNGRISARCRDCNYRRYEDTITDAIVRADVHAIRVSHTVDVKQGREKIVTTSLPLP